MNGPKVAFDSTPLLVQFSANDTAAPASTAPNPYLWETVSPAPFTDHEESFASFFLELWTRIFWTSRQFKSGFASRISAITPDTRGVALDVPPKSCVTSPPLYPPVPVISVVVMPS